MKNQDWTLLKMKTAMQNSKVRNTLLFIYVLAVLGFSASAKATMEKFPIVRNVSAATQTKTLVGEVALATDGRVYLVVSDNVVFEMRHHEEELSALNGQQVQITGYELMRRVGPVYQLSSFDPLSDDVTGQPNSTPVLVVLGISGITQ